MNETSAQSDRFTDALWDRWVRPGPVGALMLVTVLLVILQRMAGGETLGALIRLIAGLAILGMIGLALELFLGGSSRRTDLLARLGQVGASPFPFFRAELRSDISPVCREGHPRAARSAALSLVISAVLVGLMAVVASTEGLVPAEVELLPGEMRDVAWMENRTTGRAVEQMLPFRVRTRGAQQSEAGTWVTRLEFDDLMREAPVVSDLRAGGHLFARGWTVGLREVRPVADPGFAHLSVRMREGDEVHEHRVRVGGSVEVAGVRLLVAEASVDRLGNLGSAVRIEEYVGEQLVRDAWVYEGAAQTDRAHGGGETVVELVGLEPQRSVVLSLREGGARDVLIWLAVLLVGLVGGLWGMVRAPVWLSGRDGDWQLAAAGVTAKDRGARGTALRERLLDDAQREELAGLEEALRRSKEEGR